MSSSQGLSRKTAETARSENECYDLLVKEISSIPDREVPVAENGESTAKSSRFGPRSQLTHGSTQSTSTNVMIAKTIRAAMAGIRPGS
ncbi:hypothetical protein NOR_07694 [Metarhizium rileyi]|uniref:Uncharacterized protein n=1 Tax=Metarhizium rileyi (strain RCEF 4871) TaxID=1649241 RepID=A0A166XR39_METRR|nr:hypothetical protein NOR_07694 [Metarhizium rileyi RCEF 4871]TWU72934.1 hypothetical protein ED733_001956 [Metarhizium rileyi]